VRNCAVPLHKLGRNLVSFVASQSRIATRLLPSFQIAIAKRNPVLTHPNPTKPIVRTTCFSFPFAFLSLKFNATHLRGGQRQPNTCPSIPIAIPPSVRLAHVPCTPSHDNHCCDLVWILVLEVSLGAMKRAKGVTLVTLRLVCEARRWHVW
jgi:hypothetical protein